MPDPVAFEYETARALLKLLRKSKDGQYENPPDSEIPTDHADPFVWVYNTTQAACTYDATFKAWLIPNAVLFFPIAAGVNADDEVQFGKTNNAGLVTGGIACKVYTPRLSGGQVAPVIAIGHFLGALYGYDGTGLAQIVIPNPVAPVVNDSGNATITVVSDVWSTPVGMEVSYVQFSGKDYDTAIIRSFLGLSDVLEATYVGREGQVVTVNSTATGLIFAAGGGEGGGATSFIELDDCPASYQGAFKSVIINSDNNGLTFGGNAVTAKFSIGGGGNPNAPSYIPLQLIGDTALPAAFRYYGTNSKEQRGYHVFPEGNVLTQYSITGTGLTATKIQLVGDTDEPPPYYYYGTDAGGDKGYVDLAAAIESLIEDGGADISDGDF